MGWRGKWRLFSCSSCVIGGQPVLFRIGEEGEEEGRLVPSQLSSDDQVSLQEAVAMAALVPLRLGGGEMEKPHLLAYETKKDPAEMCTGRWSGGTYCRKLFGSELALGRRVMQ